MNIDDLSPFEYELFVQIYCQDVLNIEQKSMVFAVAGVTENHISFLDCAAVIEINFLANLFLIWLSFVRKLDLILERLSRVVVVVSKYAIHEI